LQMDDFFSEKEQAFLFLFVLRHRWNCSNILYFTPLNDRRSLQKWSGITD